MGQRRQDHWLEMLCIDDEVECWQQQQQQQQRR
jgi:hypothetical protein